MPALRPIAFDLTRMFVAASGTTPRGIDRVDMGYATRVFAEPAANVGLLPSPFHMGVLSGRCAARLTARVERNWQEDGAPDRDGALDGVRRRLQGYPTEAADTAPLPLGTRLRTGRRYAAMLADALASPWQSARRAVPEGAVYVNTGQVLLGAPWFFRWLDRRPDVRPVFLVHDVIPMLYPEYTGPFMAWHHQRAVATVARRAAALIATSHASASEIHAAAADLGRRDLPTLVVRLPVSASLLQAGPRPFWSDRQPYFVTVGNIDQRKNHLLLLQAWRELIQSGGETPPPKLVIIGARGLRVAGLIDVLERSPALRTHVIEATNVSTPVMRELIRGARAVLMPSFTEGFGLPIIEALALGTPVIASNIPVHREVGGERCTYLHPLDGLGWMREIARRAAEPDAAVERRRASLTAGQPPNWSGYFDEVMPFLQSL